MEEDYRRLGSTSLFAVFTLGFAMFAPVNGEIRCYCNLPVCVTTGYMCKSSANACFSELNSHNSDPLRSRHGCYELLHRPKKELCLGRIRNSKVTFGKFPLLLCCPEDMCNYAETLDLRIHLKNNETTYVSGVADQDGNLYYTGSSSHEATTLRDLWFKAAVIAVPIAGCFILVMLVLLAVRMLKKDSKRQGELLAFRQQRHLKAQMLLGDHLKSDYERHHLDGRVEEKNEANARLNQKQNNLYKNVNLVLCTEPSYNEKQYIYDRPFHNANSTLCGSLVAWGKMNWQPTTTHV